VLRATELLKEALGDDAVVFGVVISPFSLPTMQMGFDRYLNLLYEQPELLEPLLKVNKEFCVSWANAQIAAGANAMVYFDLVSSPTIIPKKLFLETGLKVAQRTIRQIAGPVANLFASGLSLPLVDEIASTGASMLTVSCDEDLAAAKSACAGRLTIIGNSNGIEMRNWTAGQAEAAFKDAISRAAPGGGYILSDCHGEIPHQVPEEVLLAISEAAREWGCYPLTWLDDG
jgi:uroporphyrinogen decarboxylase